MRPADNSTMTMRATIPQPHLPADQIVPPLEPGDHLTRDEFERRYNAMPEQTKAELIEGVVYMSPPALRWNHHAGPHADMMTWLGTYHAFTPGVRLGDAGSVRLDLDNEPQPDAVMVIEPECGGQVRYTDDDYLEGAPELVGEVSASSVSIDMNAKLRAYRRNGVREYIVWRVNDRTMDWFALRQGDYKPLPPSEDGILRSEVFPGLWLDSESMLRADLATVLRILQRGVEAPEHASFVGRLKSHSAAPQSPRQS
jgi:hypothetical protein